MDQRSIFGKMAGWMVGICRWKNVHAYITYLDNIIILFNSWGVQQEQVGNGS